MPFREIATDSGNTQPNCRTSFNIAPVFLSPSFLGSLQGCPSSCLCANEHGVSRPPEVTSLTVKIGLVSGRTTSQVAQSRTVRGVSEVVAVTEVEVVENRDKNHGPTAADNAASTAPAHTTWDSAAAPATEKEVLGWEELHRLLINRQGSLSATYKKIAEANDKAYDMNQKTVQALYTLAEECSILEVTMKKKVMFEYEEGDVLYAVVLEVSDEHERAQKDQDPCAGRTGLLRQSTLPGNSPIVGPHKKQQLQKQAALSEQSAIDVQPTRRSASKLEKAWQRTYDLKKEASKAQENVFSHNERTKRISNEHARAEGLFNDGLGSLGQAVRAAAQATHSLTCGVPDKEK